MVFSNLVFEKGLLDVVPKANGIPFEINLTRTSTDDLGSWRAEIFYGEIAHRTIEVGEITRTCKEIPHTTLFLWTTHAIHCTTPVITKLCTEEFEEICRIDMHQYGEMQFTLK
jgi:hypothetical protein